MSSLWLGFLYNPGKQVVCEICGDEHRVKFMRRTILGKWLCANCWADGFMKYMFGFVPLVTQYRRPKDKNDNE